MYDFRKIIDLSREKERSGDYEGACNTRYEAFQRLYETLPEDEETVLDWDDAEERSAIELVNHSAIDHFLVGDWEMAAGMFELVLELDPEDHLEATTRLAYTYIALGEFDSFDEVINDISDKHADKQVLLLWSEWRRSGNEGGNGDPKSDPKASRLPGGHLVRFKSRFAPYYREFTTDEHPVDAAYLADIDSERPTQQALARELWLQTEHLWTLFPDFINQLKIEN